jgi:FkbM family methyltransferase
MSTEPDMVPGFLRYARQSTLFVDAGANTGFYTLLAHAANPNIQIRAFEPNPAVFKKLARHVELNGLAACTQLHAVALGNSTGTGRFQIPEDATMAHIAAPGDGTDGIQVPIGQPVDLMKIDVEGYELGVLQGMSTILRAHRPVLFFECLPGSITSAPGPSPPRSINSTPTTAPPTTS